MKLTALVHQRLRQLVKPGDHVVDATAGNGHDTLVLAELVGEEGLVFAFDVQQAALENSHKRLEEAGLASRVRFFEEGHERMASRLPEPLHGRLTAVVFNLGYLPGSDKRCITRPDTTLAALRQAVRLLRPGGIASVLAYRGHAGGLAESIAVSAFFQRQTGMEVETQDSPGPVLYIATKSK